MRKGIRCHCSSKSVQTGFMRCLFETKYEELKYLRQLQEIDDLLPGTYYSLGYTYSQLLQFEKAIPEYKKALEIYDKLGIKPAWAFNYTGLGRSI